MAVAVIAFTVPGEPATAREWRLFIPIDLPSANRHGGAATNARHAANAAMYRRQRVGYVASLKNAAWKAGIRLAVSGCAGYYEPPHRTVTIVRLWGKGCRAWDDDNMVAACKGLRDAMQRERVVARAGKVPKLIPGAGIVWDDSAKWARFDYEQRKSEDGRPGVEVRVSEVGR